MILIVIVTNRYNDILERNGQLVFQAQLILGNIHNYVCV